MNYEDLLKKNKCELLLTILFILYLIIGSDDNLKMAQIVDIPQIKMAIIIVSFLLFIYCNKILGIMGIFVAYEILNFSHVMINANIINENVSEDIESLLKPIMELKSIEEEIVFKMTPHTGLIFNESSYHPFSKFLF
jgi:hypothetical protein